MTQYATMKVKASVSADAVIKAMQLNQQGQVIQLEYNDDVISGLLDNFAGIDWMLKNKNNQLLGIAARIQTTNPNYYSDPHNTFTIRYTTASGNQTEFEKRNDSILNGYIYLFYTLQAYVRKDDPTHVISAAIIKTKKLYEFVLANDYLVSEDKHDNSFKVVKWSDIKRMGYEILILDTSN